MAETKKPVTKKVNKSGGAKKEKAAKKLQTHNVHELQFISLLVGNPETLLEAAQIVKPEYMVDETLRKLYTAILTDDKKEKLKLLEKIDYNEIERVRNLTKDSKDTFKEYAKRVKENYMRRRLYELTSKAADAVLSTDSEMATARLQSRLLEITSELTDKRDPSVKHIIEMALKEIDEFRNNSKRIALPFHFSHLQDLVKGIFPHHIWVIGGHSGVGKSFFVLQLISDLIYMNRSEPIKFVIFSTENSQVDNLLRIVGARLGVPFIDIKTGNINADMQKRVHEEMKLLKEKGNLWIYDDVYDISQVMSIVQMHKIRNQCDVVMIDYIQNLNTWEKDVYTQMSKVAMGIQRMALSTEVTAICMSQLSDNQAQLEGNKMMSFKGAGEIKAVADIGIWLQQGASKKARNKMGDKLPEKESNIITANVNKVRHAQPGSVMFSFFTEKDKNDGRYLSKILNRSEYIPEPPPDMNQRMVPDGPPDEESVPTPDEIPDLQGTPLGI